MDANITQSEQAAIEQEALAKFNQSKQNIQEQVSGQTDEIPDGYNHDGTPIEEVKKKPIFGKF